MLVSLIMPIHKVTVAACSLPVFAGWVVFYYLFSAFHMNMGIGAIKRQGVLSSEVSVSMIGRLVVIDRAWPTGQPPKSIQTDGKDEMAVGT